ncbi:MAG: hypothetical protein HC857_11520 [Synechococcales cyanobacterium RU_4_20]|nr:hypothetical protein [Synechococcales cyanobacterium RU_4_20]NJR70813.1 hypothetical protein [Synechococcales cyanobacterium CRU_2_2]
MNSVLSLQENTQDASDASPSIDHIRQNDSIRQNLYGRLADGDRHPQPDRACCRE